ncbi:iron chaperone [Ferruginibacter sp.]
MAVQKIKPTTIEEYIHAASPAVQEKLWKLHACILKAAPGASEALKWRMPAYSYDKILVTFAVFKNHIGFYPMPSVLAAFTKELSSYQTAKGSVQFPIDKPLPLPLISKMVKFRVKESKEGIIKWRS